MTAQAPVNPQTAVQPWKPTEVSLDGFPLDRYNRLIPTETLLAQTEFFKPVISVVRLDVERDTYSSRDLKDGHRAIGRVGLRKLATAAAITFVDEHRSDDGKDPLVCEITTFAEMVLPSGQRIRAPGVKRVRVVDQSWASPAQKARFIANFQEHVSSRAQNRAIRALLSLQQSYPAAELARPFVVATFVPDMDHPEVRQRMLELIAPAAVSAAFGPSSAPRQVGPGAETIVVEQAPDEDEDEIAAAQFREVQTNGHATVDTTTGEIVASSEGWLDDEQPALIGQLHAALAAAPQATLSATDESDLTPLTVGLLKLPVLRWAFGAKQASEVTAAHKAAVLKVAREMGTEPFRDAWTKAAEAAQATGK